MERTKFTPHANVFYLEKDEPLIISKYLMDIFLRYENRFSDLLALYCFYYYTAKWQRTNQPKATTAYTAAGMGWGRDKVILVKGLLKNLGLIEDVIDKGRDGRMMNHYIKINLVPNHVHHSRILPRVVKSDINALRLINKSDFLNFIKMFPEKWQHDQAFQTTLKDFVIHRKEKGKSLTPTACKRLLNHLTKYDIHTVVAALDRSIHNGWTGVFPESENGTNGKKPSYREYDGMRYYLNPKDGEYYNKAGTQYYD